MKRRIALLGGSFLALLLIFGIYHLLFSGDEEPRPVTLPTTMPTKGQADNADATEGLELYIQARDDAGRLEAEYRARKWRKLAGDTYLLTEPEVQLYESRGRRIHITGDEGTISAYEVAGGVNPRQGTLSGSVEVIIDRGDPVDERPMSERPDDLIRILMDSVRFDNESLTIQTDSRVAVFSAEADIVGRGLLIQWNESPRELRELRIQHGQYMAVYDVPEEMGSMGLPGSAATQPAARVGQPAEAQTDIAGQPTTSKSARAVAATAPSSGPAASGPTSATSIPVQSKRKNIYRAVFSDTKHGVHVDYADRRLHGATELSFEFQWDRDEGGLVSARPTSRADTAGSTGPSTDAERAAAMMITWSGPLTLQPVGHTEDPSSESFLITGHGSALTLADSQATATCKALEFRHPDQRGHLIGDDAAPVRMVTVEGNQIVCPKITFDRTAGVAHLVGAGSMTGAVDAESENAQADRVVWKDSVTVQFDERTVPDGQDGAGDSQQYIRNATFRGGVKLSQEGGELTAEEVTIGFASVDNDDGDSRMRPSTLEAVGGVRITDNRQDQPMIATGQSATSNLVERSAVLRGRPAVIRQGPNRLSGPAIHLADAAESVTVVGQGVLEFTSNKDLNGNELSEPRPVSVNWSERMTYSGLQNTAAFAGRVALRSGLEQVRCGRMRLTFAPKQDKVRPDAGEPRAERLGLGMQGYSGRRISRIVAEDDVILHSRRETPARKLLRRLQLSGRRLEYDALRNDVKMIGQGMFVAEDYRQPDESGRSEDLAGNVQRPSQTVFQWHKSMQLWQDDRRVALNGDVTMVHRSGRQVVLDETLNIPAFSDLPEGRKTVLTCEQVVAKFSPPTESSEAEPGQAMEAGPSLGPLEMFSATHKVNLKDGPRQALGQRLIYDRPRDVVIVWGYLEDKSPTDASILYEEGGRSQSWSSPKIVWNRKNNRIVTQKVTGGGGR